MDASLQPQLKRAERVSQEEGKKILARKRGALQNVARTSIDVQGQAGVSVGRKYAGVRRNEFGGRGYNGDKY